MSNFLYYLTAFAIVLGVLIVVHEFGHYAIARLCGVKVLRFSVGFGRPLWLREFGPDRTQWVIAAFPLGGYVRMLDEREAPVAADELHRAFNRQSVWRRMAVVVAGPAANFLLAFVIYWGVFWHGTEELRPVLGPPVASSPAAAAGIAEGERVLKVGASEVQTWEDLRWEILRQAVEERSIRLETINARNEIAVRSLAIDVIRDGGWESDAFERLGLRLFRPQVPAVVGSVAAGSPAESAGLQAGDRVVAIDDVAIDDWRDLVGIVRESAGKRLKFAISRGGGSIEFFLIPVAHEESGRKFGRVGLAVKEVEGHREQIFVRVSHGALGSFVRAARETWEKSVFSLRMLGKMVTGEVSWRNLSGPVTIADYAGQSARLGIDYYLKFMALVSISLGVLNLLPIPILDGGHLMYYVAEIIKRGPVSEKAMEIGQQIGLALLLMLMAFAFYNDINRLLSS